MTSNKKGEQKTRKVINIQCQKMYFKNRLCHFFTIRDITKHFQYKNVKESNRNIKMYSASVSHEMLNPIKCIINFSKQMLDEPTGS